MQQGREGQLPTAALFEADGSQWQLEAVAAIADWLATALFTTPMAKIAILA